MTTQSQGHPQPFRIPIWVGAALFGAIAVFFLWEEHRAHILGALPYLLLLSCPLIHLFMHRGHGHDAGAQSPQSSDKAQGHSDDCHARRSSP
jgi:hypothetical protein